MKKQAVLILILFFQSAIFNQQSAIVNAQCGSWTQKADFGGTVRFGAAVFSIGSQGYLGTGYEGFSRAQDIWEFNASTNIWSQKTDFGGTARNFAVGFI